MTSLDWRKISQLYHDALPRNGADRAAFLDAACADNPGLRRELDSLLAQGLETAAGFGSPMLEEAIRLLADAALSGSRNVDATQPHEIEDARVAAAVGFLSSISSPLAHLSLDALGNLLSAMHVEEYGAGDFLIRQGDQGAFLLLILSGTAWARIHDAPSDGGVGEFGPGDFVGEMSLVTNEARTADVIARTPVRSLMLSAADFHRLADQHPELRVLLTNVVADRLGRATYDGLGGKDIHGYRIVRCIGRGGMGIVYEALRLATGETVALKMMNHRLVYQEGAIRRFRREAATLKSLCHPLIVPVRECFGAYKTQFLAMEFCEGSTLHEIISARGPLSESAVRRIIGQLAVALHYIHGRGLVHRDLKPSNVMVNRSGVVKLLDFGLAKFDAAWTAGEASRIRPGTQSALFAGTPGYMAPEQFSGAAVDHRTDFYALACVAYEALSGRPVIGATDVFGVIREQLRFNLPPAEAIGRGVTIEMHELLKQGLDHLPENRTLDLARLAAWAGPLELDSL